MGAEPASIALEFNRIDDGLARRGRADQAARAGGKMDSILFHPETSTRRALIQALGTYPLNELPEAEREPLIGKLLSLHRGDPDAGIHGAVEWTLRRWNNQDRLKTSAPEQSISPHGESGAGM